MTKVTGAIALTYTTRHVCVCVCVCVCHTRVAQCSHNVYDTLSLARDKGIYVAVSGRVCAENDITGTREHEDGRYSASRTGRMATQSLHSQQHITSGPALLW